jgi:hypothetical protein
VRTADDLARDEIEAERRRRARSPMRLVVRAFLALGLLTWLWVLLGMPGR